MNLVKIQIDFLVEELFGSDKLPGSRRIAEQLLATGSCIVAGDGNVWVGGVGNFIRRRPAENAVDCTLLTLDIKGLLRGVGESKIADIRLEFLNDQLEKVQAERDAIEALVEHCKKLRVCQND